MKRNLNWKMTLIFTLILLAGTISTLLSGTISGTITNETDQTVDNAYVQLMRLAPNAQNGEMLFRTTETNPGGTYTFNDIPDGDYHVSAIAPEYVRSYYVSQDGDILVVEVDADDQEVVGIDIQLTPQNDPPPPNMTGVTGRVLNLENLPVAHVPVGIVTLDDLTQPLPNLVTMSSMNGMYMLHGMLPGVYKTCVLGANLTPLAYSDEFTIVEDVITDSIDIIFDAPPPPAVGAISGHVFGIDMSMGHHSVLVGLVTPDDTTSVISNLYGHADFDGEYHIANIPVGTYRACVIGNNMTPVAYSDLVTVIANENVENVDIIIGTFEGYSLSGTVYNAENEPVQNGIVEIRSVADSTMNGFHHLHRTVHLDENGHYTFINVAEGQYYVSVWTMMSPVVFYPSTYDVDQATPVNVVDQDVSGIDITIPTPQNYTITGYVRDADTEAPLAGIRVRTDRMGFHHFPMQDSLFYNEFHALTDANGFYTITAPVGRYTLAAIDTTHYYRIQFYDHALNPFNATVILLDHDYTGIDFDLIPRCDSMNCSINGVITEDGMPITYPVTVVAVSSDEDWEDSTISGSDGTYTINHVRPGSYYVMAYTLTNSPIYYDNVLTWEDADQIIVTGAVSGIDFDLTNTNADGTCSLVGSVTDGSNPVANVMVMLTDSENLVLGFARTNEMGEYTIENVPSQTYTVVTSKIGYTTATQPLYLTGEQNLDIILNAPTANDDSYVPVTAARIGNYPNPFNPNTTIFFSTAKDSKVNVKIYNVKGQCIKNLYNDNTKAGSHTLSWDGTDDNGKHVTSGIYLLKLQGEGFQTSHKMTLMK